MLTRFPDSKLKSMRSCSPSTKKVWHPAMALDPYPGSFGDPSRHFENSGVVTDQVTREDCLVMGNPISKRPEIFEWAVSIFSREALAIREGSP